MVVIVVAMLWGLLSLSIFNILILIWLGLTVFLAAEQRSRGLYLILGGTGLGTLFFMSHSLILVSQFTDRLDSQLNFWWHLGWLPVIITPILWYWLILWYSGWPRRHQKLAWLLTGLAGFIILLLLFAQAIPDYADVIALNLARTRRLMGIPLIFILYPPLAVLCILLPIDALHHPMPPQRLMGELARQRSRPFLLRASYLFLISGLLVTLFLGWVAFASERGFVFVTGVLFVPAIAAFDLCLTILIASAILFLGRAVVSYEVFTGKTLPRRGFLRHWRNAIILSAGLSGIIGLSVIVEPPPTYSLLLLAGITMTFYALLSWRSFIHRDHIISQLRPIISGEGLVHSLTQPTKHKADSLYPFFESLCRDMLNTRQACLVPMGHLAPLISVSYVYPPSSQITLPTLKTGDFSPNVVCNSLEGALCWAVPLWSERGLIGVLLLDEKNDGSLYTQEEMDAARASAERIMDLLAGQEMAWRLMNLQRQGQIVERMLDLRTRRALHDDILPTLHLAALSASQQPQNQQVVELITEAHLQLSTIIRQAVQRGIARSEQWAADLKQMIEGEFSELFDCITWQIAPALPTLTDEMYDVLFPAVKEIVRNAATHGRTPHNLNPLHLTIQIQCQENVLCIQILDDGVGFHHSTAASHIGGNGLALHSTLLAIMGGNTSLETQIGKGTQVTITLPMQVL